MYRHFAAGFLLLLSGSFTQAGDPPDDALWVWVEQHEAPCKIRRFRRTMDGTGRHFGFKEWCGLHLTVTSSFFSEPDRDNRSQIVVQGKCFTTDSPMHYVYCVAFFDKDDNLVACVNKPVTVDNTPVDPRSSSFRSMPKIPDAVVAMIDSYRLAYFEAEVPIGRSIAAIDQISQGPRYSDADEGADGTEGDGEGARKGIQFRIRNGSRALDHLASGDCRVVSVEGECSLPKVSDSDKHESDKMFKVPVGNERGLSASCLFKFNTENSLTVHIAVENPTDKRLYGSVFIAFFDKHGNLVACTERDATTDENDSRSKLKIDGKRSPTSYWNDVFYPVAVPHGLESSITSYKVTMYESSRPIGEVVKDE